MWSRAVPHPDFKAALVASPVNGPPRARVLDLTREPIDPVTSEWREVAQSLMLFDDDGKLRDPQVEPGGEPHGGRRGRAGPAAGDHERGRLHAARVRDPARVARRSSLAHAMNMDGGYEAELLVHSGGFRYASFGRWRDDQPPDAPGAHVPLPAVIVVSARDASPPPGARARGSRRASSPVCAAGDPCGARRRSACRAPNPLDIRCPRCRYLIYDYPRPCAGVVVTKGDQVLVVRSRPPARKRLPRHCRAASSTPARTSRPRRAASCARRPASRSAAASRSACTGTATICAASATSRP